MRDQMNRNTLTVTGAPTLVDGALTVDTNQATEFDGSTNSAAAVDSASLSITSSLSVEFFLRVAAYPGTTQYAVNKSGSYGVRIGATGFLAFDVAGSGSAFVNSNVALALNRWYHIVAVYNAGYSGIQRFGKSTTGSTSQQVDDDNGNNKTVTSFTLLEPAILRTVTMSLQYVDEIWPVQMSAVVYSDSAGDPDALVTSSAVQVLNPPNPLWRSWTPVSFPLTPAVVPAGTYHIGYIADTIAGISKAPLVISADATGGNTSQRSDGVGSPSDPFGGITAANTKLLSAYCDYTALARTGFEGKIILYIDGARNTTATYTGTIADNANSLQVCPALAAQVDEVSIWNKALTSAQVATHYTAH